MVFAVDFGKPLRIDVRVNLRGLQVGMAEQLLDDAEIGAAGEQVSGERMTQGVRGDRPGDRGLAPGLRHEAPDRLPGQGTPARREEQMRIVAAPRVNRALGLNVAGQGGCGSGAERDDALLATLAEATEVAAGRVDVLETEAGEFGDAEPTRVEQLQDGAVAPGIAIERGPQRRIDQALDWIMADIEYLRL